MHSVTKKTALVHEAYLRLIDQTQAPWQNRAHFFGIAAQMMRRILIDHARAQQADKRGGEFQKLSLEENIDISGGRANELVALDEALERSPRLIRRRVVSWSSAFSVDFRWTKRLKPWA